VGSANCGTPWSQTFSFDPFGNISKTGTVSFQPTYNLATNRFQSIPGGTPTYDANGNLTYDLTHNYTWDVEGKALSVDTVNLTYDALGRMVEQNRSGTYTQIVYAPTGGKLALMGGQALQKAFVPLSGGATAVYTSSGLVYYRHSDWLGGSRLASTPSRGMYYDVAYAPYGEKYSDTGTQDLNFTGQNQDTASYLYDFLYREYHPPSGRWISPDPAGLAAVDATSPQTWNRYAYVRNNPLAYVDPDGTSDDEFTFKTTVWGHLPPPFYCTTYGCGPVIPSVGPGPSTTPGGGSSGSSGGTSTGKSAADIARCAAKFSNDHSMAAALDAATGGLVSKDNGLVNAFLGSDAATISNLITGPNRAQTLKSPGISQGAVAAVKVVGNLPNPAATGLASMGTATIRETAGGTAFVTGWTDATIATSVLGRTAGKAFAVFSISKAIWDVSTYAFGAVQCY
jgi:RHS repeat-associated protein